MPDHFGANVADIVDAGDHGAFNEIQAAGIARRFFTRRRLELPDREGVMRFGFVAIKPALIKIAHDDVGVLQQAGMERGNRSIAKILRNRRFAVVPQQRRNGRIQAVGFARGIQDDRGGDHFGELNLQAQFGAPNAKRVVLVASVAFGQKLRRISRAV